MEVRAREKERAKWCKGEQEEEEEEDVNEWNGP